METTGEEILTEFRYKGQMLIEQQQKKVLIEHADGTTEHTEAS